MSTRRLIVVAALATLFVRPVAAQEESSESERLLREGVALRERGDMAGALERFEQAVAVDGSVRAHAQAGYAHASLSHWVQAHHHLSRALLSDHPWIEEHRARLETALNTIREHVGQITLNGVPDGGEIFIDGESVGTMPMPMPIVQLPGEVNVRVVAGANDDERTFELAAQQSMVLEFEFAASDAAAQGGGTGPPVGPIVALSVSAAFAIGGTVMLTLGQLDIQSVNDSPVGTRWEDVADTASRGEILTGVGATTIAVGLVGVALSVVWWVLSEPSEDATAWRPGVFVF